MPKDSNGIELQIGDSVVIPATVTRIAVENGEEGRNLDVQFVIEFPGYPGFRQTLTLNTAQATKVVQSGS